jgi:hypothetical protein
VPASLDERYGLVVLNLGPHDLDRPTAEWLKVALPSRGGVDGLDADEVSIVPGMEKLSNVSARYERRASDGTGVDRRSDATG